MKYDLEIKMPRLSLECWKRRIWLEKEPREIAEKNYSEIKCFFYTDDKSVGVKMIPRFPLENERGKEKDNLCEW